jgi:vacuolar-type H+-ATPase subunit E/Vma4
MTMTAEQASERLEALEKRIDQVIDVLTRWLDHTQALPDEERTALLRELPDTAT